MDSVHLPCPDGWAEQAAALVVPASRRHGETIALPGQMCADFNSLQAGFQFSGRAIAGASATTKQAAATNGTRPMSAAPRQHKPAAGICVTSVTSLPEARAFAAEWAELAEAAGARNPFSHPDWLMPWAERFLSSGEQIWLLAARRHGQLVGVAPFYRRSWGPGLAHSMQLWGTGRHSDLIELPQLLLDQESPRTVARALVSRLCAEAAGWDWATVPLEDPLWLEPEWLPRGGEVMVLPKTVRPCVVLPIDQSRPPVKRNLRESLRRARNRLDRSYPDDWSVSRATARADLIELRLAGSRLVLLVRCGGRRSRARRGVHIPPSRSRRGAGCAAGAAHPSRHVLLALRDEPGGVGVLADHAAARARHR